MEHIITTVNCQNERDIDPIGLESIDLGSEHVRTVDNQ